MRLTSIQILRAVAALLVTVYHIRAIEGLAIADSGIVSAETGLPEPGLISGLWANGFIGVDMFFVISGFVMVYATKASIHGARGAVEFLFARATRIYPVWWFFATCMALYFLYAYGVPLDAEQAAASNQSKTAHVLKSYLLIPQPVFPILGVGWTLVHEMYFYVVFAGFMLLPRRFLPLLLALWAMVVFAGTFAGHSVPFAGNYVQLAVYPMTMEFIMGAAAGLLIVSGRVWRPAMITALAALTITVLMQIVTSPEHGDAAWRDHVLQWGRVLMFGVPSAVLVYGAAGLDLKDRSKTAFAALEAPNGARFTTVEKRSEAGIFTRVFSHLRRAMNRLGDWSYSIYLCHMLVLSAVRRLFPISADLLEQHFDMAPGAADWLRIGSSGLMDNLLFALISLVLTLAVSGIVYHLLERPLVGWFGRRRRALFVRA